MKILIIEQEEDLRADIHRRIEEASRSTGLRNIIIESLELKKVGGVKPQIS